jgi:UDP-N-acetylmuramoylalanine--D-glutamate ligase
MRGMEVKGRSFLVVGLGVSGDAVARFLRRRGATVTAADTSVSEALAERAASLTELGAQVLTGARGNLEAIDMTGFDAVVLSPGVPHDLPPLVAAAARGVPVMGEIELAARFLDRPIVAITGTNGKTTTTELVARMLEASGWSVFMGGNIGDPLIGVIDRGELPDRIVVELSSFQLDTIKTFRPWVATLLNITPDHLDRYADMDAYTRSKGRIFMNQTSEDVAIINGADPRVRAAADGIRSMIWVFHGTRPGERGAVRNGDQLVFDPPTGGGRFVVAAASCRRVVAAASCRRNGRLMAGRMPAGKLEGGSGKWEVGSGAPNHALNFKLQTSSAGRMPAPRVGGQFTVDLSAVHLPGAHNAENIAAAGLTALAAGATPEGIVSALGDFRGLPHRMTLVASVDGVRYIDDSKGTNIDAVARALEAVPGPVVLIMGGRNKRGRFEPLREAIRAHVKTLVVMGEAAGEIAGAVDGSVPITFAGDMTEAVAVARRAASPGDTVLLSPGCASFDMFRSYAERGDCFRDAVTGPVPRGGEP